MNWRLRDRNSRSYSLKLEKLGEEINILSNDIAEKKKNIGALESKMVRYSLLKEVAENLSSTLSLEAVGALIIDKAVRTLGKTGRAMLFLVDTERQELRLAASNGEVKAKKGDVFDRWIMRHRKPLMIEAIEADFRFTAGDIEEAKGRFRALIAAPLISENKILGILRMDNLQELTFAQDDLRLLDIVADLGAVAVQNALLYSRTQELAIRDTLTGLFVRRYFLERFKEDLARAARKKGTLSLLLLDIDHFKDYNDRYGHAAGDLVLRFLARQLDSIMRKGDIAVRFGGEEIGILLYDMDRKEAKYEAERIRKAIRDRPIIFRRKENNVTVSIGVSTYPKDAMLEEELMRIADERLYKAKELGRDRVCSE
jgi:diguanylate cyclase (GGDEF)-like protein